MLAEQVNADGGVNGRQIELTIEDNQSTEDGAAKAVNSLISSEQVDLILGASRTGPSLAMRPIAEQAEIPMISLAANQAIVDGAVGLQDRAERPCRHREARRRHDRQGLQEDRPGPRRLRLRRGVAEMFAEIGEQGISVVAIEKFAPDATDFTAQMVNIRNAAADVTVIWGIPPAAGLAQKAYRQLGIATPSCRATASATRCSSTRR